MTDIIVCTNLKALYETLYNMRAAGITKVELDVVDHIESMDVITAYLVENYTHEPALDDKFLADWLVDILESVPYTFITVT